MFKNPFAFLFYFLKGKRNLKCFYIHLWWRQKKACLKAGFFLDYFKTLLFYFGNFYYVGRQVQVHRCAAGTYGNVALF